VNEPGGIAEAAIDGVNKMIDIITNTAVIFKSRLVSWGEVSREQEYINRKFINA
jgi:hypothetical protein